MEEIWSAFQLAFALILAGDGELGEIILLSLRVSLGALAISALLGLPIGAATALYRFPGRRVLIVTMNALMGLPPVVVGLIVYLLFSRAGPFGVLGLLFTPTAMIVAQVILVTPIIASLTRQVLESLWEEYDEQLRSLGLPAHLRPWTLFWDGRFALLTAMLAGFGRAISEVGAVMIVGGNIDHVTRVMTTAIALEASRGNISLALALGLVLLLLSLAVNAGAHLVKEFSQRRYAL